MTAQDDTTLQGCSPLAAEQAASVNLPPMWRVHYAERGARMGMFSTWCGVRADNEDDAIAAARRLKPAGYFEDATAEPYEKD